MTIQEQRIQVDLRHHRVVQHNTKQNCISYNSLKRIFLYFDTALWNYRKHNLFSPQLDLIPSSRITCYSWTTLFYLYGVELFKSSILQKGCIVHFVDICGIYYHHCLICHFIIYLYLNDDQDYPMKTMLSLFAYFLHLVISNLYILHSQLKPKENIIS